MAMKSDEEAHRRRIQLGTGTEISPARPRRAAAVFGGYLRQRPVLALIVIFSSIVGGVLSLVPVILLSEVIDAVIGGAGQNTLLRIVLVSALALVGAALLNGAAESLLGVLLAGFIADLRERAVAATLNLPTARIEQVGRGDILGRVGADMAVLVVGVQKTIPAILNALILVVAASGGIAGLDWMLALAGLCAAPFYFRALWWYLPRSAPLHQRQRVIEGEMLGSLMASVDAIRTLRSHGMVDERRRLVINKAAESRDTSVAAFRRFSGLVARENRAEFVGIGMLMVIGWLLIRGDAVTLGETSAALILFHRQFVPIGAILFSFEEAQRTGAALTRIVGLIDETGGQVPGKVSADILPKQPASLRIRDLTHTYPDGRCALRGVDIDVAPGHTVAVVGGSGAGKSTVAGIIAGTIEHAGVGKILINDVDLATLPSEVRRASVCMASQEYHVFAVSVRENLALADSPADDYRMSEALRAVGLGKWAQKLPEGLDTILSADGIELDRQLSQRLTLARVALSQAPVVVLDESTAEEFADVCSWGGDISESSLEEAARRAIGGRTAVVIAHRLTQAATADQLVVMDEGRIIERGTHVDALSRNGAYARLWWAWQGGTSGNQTDHEGEKSS